MVLILNLALNFSLFLSRLVLFRTASQSRVSNMSKKIVMKTLVCVLCRCASDDISVGGYPIFCAAVEIR